MKLLDRALGINGSAIPVAAGEGLGDRVEKLLGGAAVALETQRTQFRKIARKIASDNDLDGAERESLQALINAGVCDEASLRETVRRFREFEDQLERVVSAELRRPALDEEYKKLCPRPEELMKERFRVLGRLQEIDIASQTRGWWYATLRDLIFKSPELFPELFGVEDQDIKLRAFIARNVDAARQAAGTGGKNHAQAG